MSYEYVIRKFDKVFGQLHIECGDITFCFDIPIKDDRTYPTGAELDELIKSVIPVWHFERKDKIAAGVLNEAEIDALVVPYPEPEPDLINLEQEQAMSSDVPV
jgi:hypothetical protein